MKEDKKEIRKWLTIILIAIVGYWAINNLSTLGNFIGKIISIIFPFILGGSLAFILNIPMTFFEKNTIVEKEALQTIKKKKKDKKKKSSKKKQTIKNNSNFICNCSYYINLYCDC